MGNEYLRELQLTEVEILDEIVRICKEHKLDYYLIGGTLLGAVRHKGFIPWDDDLDIVMPRESFDCFIHLCQQGYLNEKFYLHSKETDREYWLAFPKIRKKNTVFDEKSIAHMDAPKGIYVDIFPLDEACSENSRGKQIRTKIIKHISALISTKKKIPGISSKAKIVYFPILWIPTAELTRFQSWLMQYENGKGGSYFVNYGSNYNTVKQTMPKNVYEPAGTIVFEGKEYQCPNDWDYVLKRIYGSDYMQLPPPEKRITHCPVRVCFDTRYKEDGKNG